MSESGGVSEAVNSVGDGRYTILCQCECCNKYFRVEKSNHCWTNRWNGQEFKQRMKQLSEEKKTFEKGSHEESFRKDMTQDFEDSRRFVRDLKIFW